MEEPVHTDTQRGGETEQLAAQGQYYYGIDTKRLLHTTLPFVACLLLLQEGGRALPTV